MNLIPGIVAEYDRARRMARVRIPGKTDGAAELPWAEFLNPLGDKSEHTEIRLLPGDRVWLAFQNDDPRYPVIMGYRPKQTGNVVEFRRWHHENIESDADESQKHTAGTDYTIEAGGNVAITADGDMDLEAGGTMTLKVGGTTIVLTSDSITFTTPEATFTTPLATFSALVQIAGLLSANGGLAALGVGGGAAATMIGSLQVSSGDVTADDVSLKTHGHIEQGDGARTGNPVA